MRKLFSEGGRANSPNPESSGRKRLSKRAIGGGLSAALVAGLALTTASPALAVSKVDNVSIDYDQAPKVDVDTTTSDKATTKFGVPPGSPVTMHYGAGDNERANIRSFSVGGVEYQAIANDEAGTRIEFLRRDNDYVKGVRDNLWLANPKGAGLAGYTDVVGSDITNETMEYALASPRLTSGTDNLFANVASNGEPNPNNIERASLLNVSPVTAVDPDKLGIMIAERGGNDSFKIAAVTGVDADGHPNQWGPIVPVEASHWGTLIPSITSTVMMKQQGVDAHYRPSDWTDSQPVTGVYVDFAELGVEKNQVVYGVSLAGGDEDSMETDHAWNTKTPYNGPGGLDMVSAYFASAVEPGLDLKKTSDPAPGATVEGGQKITYTVTAQNTGATNLDPATVTDDLSQVLGKAEYNGDATATIGGDQAGELTVDGTDLSWQGVLRPLDTLTITYSVTVNENASGELVKNRVTASGTPPTGPPVTPPPAETEHPVATPGFEITKTADPESGTEVTSGDTITYTVTGTNTGDTALDPVSINDDLSKVLDKADYNDDVSATSGDVTVDGTDLAWTGKLAKGEQVTITYSVTVNPEAAGQKLNNVVVGEATPLLPDPDDPDGPGIPGKKITPPPVQTEHPVPDAVPGFEIDKTADPASGTEVAPGDKITYTVTGTNTGGTALDPVSINDDLSNVLDKADYNDDVTASIDGQAAGDVTVDGTDLSWTGELDKGEQVTITYSVTVKADAAGKVVKNVATGEATPPEGEKIVSPPVETEHKVPNPGFEIDKSADPASGTEVVPGDKITYTVTGTNTGDTVLDPATIKDDLSKVLDKAQYNGDVEASTGDVTVKGDDLSWTGKLDQGEQVTITYSVTVKADAAGKVVKNVATGDATPLLPNPEDPDGPGIPGKKITTDKVTTEHPVPEEPAPSTTEPPTPTEPGDPTPVPSEPGDPTPVPSHPSDPEPPLASTGAQVGIWSAFGLLLVGAGALLVLRSRRRGQH